MIPISDAARDLNTLFLNSLNVYTEYDAPVHERWTKILMVLPELVGAHMFDDFQDIYVEALTSFTGAKLRAALNLCALQRRFIIVLSAAGMIPDHILKGFDGRLSYMQARLLERHGEARRTPERTGGRIRKAVADASPIPTWMH